MRRRELAQGVRFDATDERDGRLLQKRNLQCAVQMLSGSGARAKRTARNGTMVERSKRTGLNTGCRNVAKRSSAMELEGRLDAIARGQDGSSCTGGPWSAVTHGKEG